MPELIIYQTVELSLLVFFYIILAAHCITYVHRLGLFAHVGGWQLTIVTLLVTPSVLLPTTLTSLFPFLVDSTISLTLVVLLLTWWLRGFSLTLWSTGLLCFQAMVVWASLQVG